MKRCLLVALGGAIGSVLRYLIGAAIGERYGARYAFGTLAINISACFLIGLTVEYLNHHTGLNPALRYLIPIGFIGGYSTFSTFEWEAWSSISSGAYWVAAAYVAISVVAGILAVSLGTAAAKAIG